MLQMYKYISSLISYSVTLTTVQTTEALLAFIVSHLKYKHCGYYRMSLKYMFLTLKNGYEVFVSKPNNPSCKSIMNSAMIRN